MTTKKMEQTREIFDEIKKHPARSLVVSELLEHLMAVWGGPAKFATGMFTEYSNGKIGGFTRARLLSDVIRLFVINTQSLKGSSTTVEGLSDEELKTAIKELTDVDSSGSP